MKVVLACHIGLQSLRHLLDAFNFIQKLEDVFVFDAFNPQLPQLVPFTVEQHLTRKEVLLHLQDRVTCPVTLQLTIHPCFDININVDAKRDKELVYVWVCAVQVR